LQGNLDISGIVRAQCFLQYSDQRLKRNIKPIPSPLECIQKLEGRTYTWKEDAAINHQETPNRTHSEGSARQEFGLIAQVCPFINSKPFLNCFHLKDIEKILPDLVHRSSGGDLTVNYSGLFPVLIEGMKEHLKRTEEDRKEAIDRLQRLEMKIVEIGKLSTFFQEVRNNTQIPFM
jgi:hypothetical protein